MSNLDFSHCFRKAFTRMAYQKLKDGNSLNIVGIKDTGRKRLLEDIQKLALQEGFTVVLVDIGSYKHNYNGFTDHVLEQLTLQQHNGEQEVLPAQTGTSNIVKHHFSVALKQYLSQQNRILLLIDNFDALLDNPKQQFPKTFFDDLTSLCRQSFLSLCAVTKKSHLQSFIHYRTEDGESLINELSWLELEILPIEVPVLSDIRQEVNRRVGHIESWQLEPQKERIVKGIQEHAAYYRFLEIVCNSFVKWNRSIMASQRLKKCRTEYKKYHARGSSSKLIAIFEKFMGRIMDLLNKKKDQ